jgi:hypothetical protein
LSVVRLDRAAKAVRGNLELGCKSIRRLATIDHVPAIAMDTPLCAPGGCDGDSAK